MEGDTWSAGLSTEGASRQGPGVGMTIFSLAFPQPSRAQLFSPSRGAFNISSRLNLCALPGAGHKSRTDKASLGLVCKTESAHKQVSN